MRRKVRRSKPDEGTAGAAAKAAELLRGAADEIDGNPLWYRSKGFADYFVTGDLGKGSHFGRRGDYINRLTGLPFFLDVEQSAFDDAYRCADGQLRLAAARILDERLFDVEEHAGYQLASKTAVEVVAARSRGCTTLEEFNDDPGLCAGGADVAAVFRTAAGRLARAIR